MGLKNWILTGNVDGFEGLEREAQESFKRKFPYSTIKGVLGGVGGENNSTKPPDNLSAEQSYWFDYYLKTASDAAKGYSGDCFSWQLINKETGTQEEVRVKLDYANSKLGIAFPDIDIPPFSAEFIRPVHELVNRYIPTWSSWQKKPEGEDFALAVARTLWGRTFTFQVTGVTSTNSKWYERKPDTLLVWSDEITEIVIQQMVKFRKELEEIKKSFPGLRKADESILEREETFTGRVLQSKGAWFGIGYSYNYNVELDGVKIYTIKLKDVDKLSIAGEDIARQAAAVNKFTIANIDHHTLTAMVTSPEIEKLVARAIQEAKELEIRARRREAERISREKAEEWKNKLGLTSLLIDGNNIVRCGCDMLGNNRGWLVLKTLLNWLNQNGIEPYLYFDASVEYLGTNGHIDAEGMAFIKSLLEDKRLTTKCPSRDEADKFILHHADRIGGHVISNDGYKQWDQKYPWIAVKNNSEGVRRVHKFVVVDWHLSIADLEMFEEIESP